MVICILFCESHPQECNFSAEINWSGILKNSQIVEVQSGPLQTSEMKSFAKPSIIDVYRGSGYAFKQYCHGGLTLLRFFLVTSTILRCVKESRALWGAVLIVLIRLSWFCSTLKNDMSRRSHNCVQLSSVV